MEVRIQKKWKSFLTLPPEKTSLFGEYIFWLFSYTYMLTYIIIIIIIIVI